MIKDKTFCVHNGYIYEQYNASIKPMRFANTGRVRWYVKLKWILQNPFYNGKSRW
jgi:hypothetical protein